MRRRRDENRFSMDDDDDEFLSFDSLEEYQEGAGAFGSDRDLRAIGICWLCIAVPSVFLFMFFPRAVDALGLSGGAPYNADRFFGSLRDDSVFDGMRIFFSDDA